MEKKIFFAKFEALERRASDATVLLRMSRVMDADGKLCRDSMDIPLSSCSKNMTTGLYPGDDVVFRLVRNDPQYVGKTYMECMYVVPYWYQDVPASEWNMILDEIMGK